MTTRVDAAVIGGGVIGCAVAYYLAKAGARVAVLERSVIGSGASSVNPGSIAMATKKGGLLLALARASQQLHATLSRELGTDTEYGVEGNLIIAENAAELDYLTSLHAGQRQAGIAVELVDEARCRALNPLLEGPVAGGIYCPTDAHANPFKVTAGYAQAAEALGTRLLHGTAVTGIAVRDGRVAGVDTARGRIAADWVINATGAWAAEIGRWAGVEHDVLPRRGQVLVLEPADALPGIRVSGASQLVAKHAGAAAADPVNVSLSYTRKGRSGTVILGSTNEFAGYDTRTTAAGVHGIARCAVRAMPALARHRVVRAWAGLRPYCAAGPQLGYLGGPHGYLVATGHGGDGMALSAITGVYLAEVVASDMRAPPVAEFVQQWQSQQARDAAAV